jgi:hypothetical protein
VCISAEGLGWVYIHAGRLTALSAVKLCDTLPTVTLMASGIHRACEFLEGFLSAAREAEAAGAGLDDVVELAALPHLHTRTCTQTLTVMNHGYSKNACNEISMVKTVPFLVLRKANHT